MSTWTAAKIGAYDQALSGTDAELDVLVIALKIGIAEAGEHQALADVAALLNARDDKRGLLGLLMAALRRISAETTEETR